MLKRDYVGQEQCSVARTLEIIGDRRPASALAALAKAVDAGDPFRLVLSDALMPDVEGFALGRV